MIIKFNKSDKEPIKLYKDKYYNNDILKTLSDDYKDEELLDVTVQNRFVGYDDKRFKEIKRYIDRIKSLTKCDVSIKKLNSYFFDIKISGTLIDANSIYVNILQIFNPHSLHTSMQIDSNLEESVRIHRGFNYNYSSSLILKFLSERNGNEDIGNVFDIMRRNNEDNKFGSLIIDLFNTLYNVSIDEFRKLDAKMSSNGKSSGGKMTLEAIDIKELKCVSDEVNHLIGEES
jgi:hypothetical protein